MKSWSCVATSVKWIHISCALTISRIHMTSLTKVLCRVGQDWISGKIKWSKVSQQANVRPATRHTPVSRNITCLPSSLPEIYWQEIKRITQIEQLSSSLIQILWHQNWMGNETVARVRLCFFIHSPEWVWMGTNNKAWQDSQATNDRFSCWRLRDRRSSRFKSWRRGRSCWRVIMLIGVVKAEGWEGGGWIW